MTEYSWSQAGQGYYDDQGNYWQGHYDEYGNWSQGYYDSEGNYWQGYYDEYGSWSQGYDYAYADQQTQDYAYQEGEHYQEEQDYGAY